MFGLRKKKEHLTLAQEISKEVIQEVTKETGKMIHTVRLDIQHRFSELTAEVRDLRQGLKHLESQLLIKDLKDKQHYGQLHYKLHEVKSKEIEDEVLGLHSLLSEKKLL
jgi:hypothetical protein